MTWIDPSNLSQLLVAAIAGWVAGRGRLRAELVEERNKRVQLETQLESTMRELAFTNALVVELVGKHGVIPSHTQESFK